MKKSQAGAGIKIDNNIRITTDAVTRHKSFEVILQSLFILSGVIGIIYCWIEGFSLSIDHNFFLMGLIITVMVHIGLNEIKRYQAAFFLLYFAVIGGLTYHYWAYIVNGFYRLENAIIEKAAVYYELNPVRFVVEQDYVKSTMAFMLLVVQAVALITALEVYKHYMRSIYLFLILLFYGGLLAVGLVPPESFMILTLLSFISFRTMDRIPGAYHKFSLLRQKSYQEVAGDGKQKLRIKSALIMVAYILASLLVVRTFISKGYYDQHIDLTNTRKVLQKAITEFSVSKVIDGMKDNWNELNPFSSDQDLTSGGLDSGKLGNVGEVTFTGETALNVTVDQDVSYLYLKGFAGGRYKSNEWVDLSNSEQAKYLDIVKRYGNGKYSAETLLWEWISFNRFTTSEINLGSGDVLVDYVHANSDFLYAPYSSNYKKLGELSCIGDQYIISEEDKTSFLYLDSYIPYYKNTDLNHLIPNINRLLRTQEIEYSYDYLNFIEFEAEYRKFVHEAYTRLPSQGLERLRSVQLHDIGTGPNKTEQIIKSVITYLHEHTDYSLSPGVPDEGEDFAEYFLFDKKEGFCSHYATAAVLLLRNYNIPARYIEGYVVTNQDITKSKTINGMRTVEVKDYNAHAWVEVYIDSVGWVPVEVTKGYSDNGVPGLLSEIEDKKEKPEPTVTKAPVVSPTNKPQATKSPTKAPKDKGAKEEPDSGQETIEESNSSKGTTIEFSLGFLGFASFLAIISFFIVHYLLKKWQWKRVLTKEQPNEMGLYCYEQIEKLLGEFKIIKSETTSYEDFAIYAMQTCSQLPIQFDEINNLALKAKFAKEGITTEEAVRIHDYYLLFLININQSESKRRCFILKYWKGY